MSHLYGLPVVSHSLQVLGSAAASMTFSGIPAGYSGLLIVLRGRDTANSGVLLARVRFNADTTAANYSSGQATFGEAAVTTSAATASSTAGIALPVIPGVSGNANAVGSATLWIPQYAATDHHKAVHVHGFAIYGAGPTVRCYAAGGAWLANTAITQVVVTCGGTTFATGFSGELFLV